MASSIQQKKAKVFGYIDSLYAMFNKVSGIYDTLLTPNININENMNPFEFILALLQHIGVSYEEMVDFLAKYLTYAIPALEMSTKAILLAQLKKSVSCSLDPRIPDEIRTPATQLSNDFDATSADRSGIAIDIDAIDLKNKLNTINPLGPTGRYYYFGVQNYGEALGMNVHQLSRADDFDAFIWYVMHKARYVNNQSFDRFSKILPEGASVMGGNDSNSAIFSPFCLKTEEIEGVTDKLFTPGKTVSLTNGKILNLCVQTRCEHSDYNQNSGTKKSIWINYFWPVSINWESANWYTNSKYYYGYNLGLSKANFSKAQGDFEWLGLDLGCTKKNDRMCVISHTNNRNYTEERPICNLRYIEDRTRLTNLLENTGMNYNMNDRTLILSVLPKPFVHYPGFKLGYTGSPSSTAITYDTRTGDVTKIEVQNEVGDKQEDKLRITENPFRIKRLTFNEKGVYDKNGQYTICDVQTSYRIEAKKLKNGYAYEFDGKKYEKVTTISKVEDIGTQYMMNGDGPNAWIFIGGTTGNIYYSENWETDYAKFLHPCYKGLTVYEFNYDFVMSLKLFDAKNIVQNIFEALANTRVGASLNLSADFRQDEVSERIHQIVKNIIESSDSTYADCYYSFDNSKYDAMLKKTEDKRKARKSFGEGDTRNIDLSEAYKILEDFNDNASLNVQEDTLKRAITQATVSFSDNGDSQNTKFSAKLGFLFSFTELLSRMFIEAILTPKVLLIFEVNKQLMGETTRVPSLDDIIKQLSEVIIPIIKSIIDSIVQELITFALSKLQPLITLATSAILKEVISTYRELLKQIIENCALHWGRQKLNSYLDVVDYADIDPQGDEPITEKGNC